MSSYFCSWCHRERQRVKICFSARLRYLLERQVVGEGALHVIVLTGRVHIVSAYLQDRVQNKLSATAHVTAALECEVCQRIGVHRSCRSRHFRVVAADIFYLFDKSSQSPNLLKRLAALLWAAPVLINCCCRTQSWT